MIILNGGKFDGNLWSNKIAFEAKTKFTLKGNLNSGEIIPSTISPKEIDFDYIKQLEFK